MAESHDTSPEEATAIASREESIAFVELEKVVGIARTCHSQGHCSESVALFDFLASRPPRRDRASDHAKVAPHVRSLLECAAVVLASPSSTREAVGAAARLVLSIATRYEPKEFFCREVIESRVSVALGKAAASSLKSPMSPALSDVLATVDELSFDKEIARQMTEPGSQLLSSLPDLLSLDLHAKGGAAALEIVWNALELSPDAKSAADLPRMCSALQAALSKYEKDALVTQQLLLVASLVAQSPGSFSAFCKSKLLDSLICISEQAESLKLAWAVLETALQHGGQKPGSEVAPSQQDVLNAALLAHIGNSEELASPQGSPVMKDLAIKSLRLLRRVVKLFPSSFSSEGGVAAIARLVVALSRAPTTPSATPLLVASLRLLNEVAFIFADSLGESEAFPALVSLLRHDTAVESQALALSCISGLCAQSAQNRKKLCGPPVRAIISFIRYDEGDPSHSEEVVVSAIDCAWVAIVGDDGNAASFVAAGGVEAVLGLAATCPPFMRPPLVGCLSDLAHRKDARQRMVAWRGERGATLAKQVIRFWEEEQVRLRVATAEDGTLRQGTRPLSSARERAARNSWRQARGLAELKGQPEDGSFQSNTSLARTSRTIRDPVARERLDATDGRTGLHCLARAIFEEGGAGGLQADDQATVALALKYEDIMTGGVLADVSEELACEGTRPVHRDQEELDAAITRSEAAGQSVRDEQKRLLEQQRHAQHKSELEAFRELIQKRSTL